jgi:hypothetical protein
MVAQLEAGMLLRDVRAHTLEDREVYASDFRGRRNLVLIFPGQEREEFGLLNELRQHATDLQEEEAIVLIADGDNEAGRYGTISPEGRRIAAVYVADRYGEVYFTAHCEPGKTLPGAAEVLDWLRFINAQCPE